MKYECRFLAHQTFLDCRAKTIDKDKKLKKSCDDKIDLIRQNPLVGSTIKYLPPKLAGKVRKIKIGGRRGHSLCWIYFERQKIAVGVYITPEKRGDIDYVSFPDEISELFFGAIADYRTGDSSKFFPIE